MGRKFSSVWPWYHAVKDQFNQKGVSGRHPPNAMHCVAKEVEESL